MKTLEELIEALKTCIGEYKSTDNFKNHPINRQLVRTIEIAMLLAELGFDNNRPIKESEKYWFQGCYQISYDFGGKWRDIGDLYCSMVDELNRLKLLED